MVRLKAERLQRGWTLQDLGYKARIQASDISKIERQVLRPYPAQLARLAKVLKCPAEDLLLEVSNGTSQETARVG